MGGFAAMVEGGAAGHDMAAAWAACSRGSNPSAECVVRPPPGHRSSAPGFLETSQTAYREPREVGEQLRILVFQSLQSLGVGHVHHAILHLPVIKCRLAHTVLAGQIGRLRTRLMLAQNRDDLLFREPLPLHPSFDQGTDSNLRWRKFSVAGQRKTIPPSRSTPCA